MGKAKTIGSGLFGVRGAAVLFVLTMFAGSAFGFTIRFNAGTGGTVSPASAQTVAGPDGDTLTSLPTPTKSNAVYKGWYTAASGGDSVTTKRVYVKDTTIYARWMSRFTVRFSANGGVGVSDSSITVDSGAILRFTSFPPDPTRAAYKFAGWFTASTGGEEVVKDTVITKSNIVFYAQWTLITYEVRFIANGGTVSTSRDTAVTGAGGKIASASIPTAAQTTRAGYTFVGWYKEDGGLDTAKVSTNTVFTANTTVYARWLPKTYNISYALNNGIVDPAAPNPKSYTVEDNITLNNPTRRAFTFLGWTGSGLGKDTILTVFLPQPPPYDTGAKSFTAMWDVNVYTITFQSDDTTIIMETGKTVAAAGKIASLPASPKGRGGYTFDGWYYMEGDSAVKVSTSTIFDAHAIVEVKWKPVPYTINYQLNGGVVDTATPNPKTYTIEDEITLNNPTRRAFTFLGWTGTGIPKSDTLTTVFIMMGDTGSKTFSAAWALNTYTITFETGDSSITMTTGKTVATAGKLASLPSLKEKSGFLFEGWFLESGDDSLVKVTTSYVFDGDETAYAVWTPVYTIKLDAKGGTVSSTSIKTGSGGKIPSLPTPTRTGFLFDGWYTEYDEEEDEYGGDKVTERYVFEDDATLFASWSTSYTITFGAGPNAKGKLTAKVDTSTVTSGDSVRVGKSVVFTAVPDSGYRVDAWLVNGDKVADSGSVFTLTGVSVKETEMAVEVVFNKAISVASHDRVIPAASSGGVVAVAPAAALTAEFTAGPNPVGRPLGSVNVFRQGVRAVSGALYVYDASGNFVNKIAVSDKSAGGSGGRAVASWNLSDKKGRPVPEGTYLIKGAVKTAGGNSEKVSLVVGVR